MINNETITRSVMTTILTAHVAVATAAENKLQITTFVGTGKNGSDGNIWMEGNLVLS
jgi:NAD(P)H-hydrate repair Nnr-like enzyme with NAD(P)H-hydrate epimerase domain